MEDNSTSLKIKICGLAQSVNANSVCALGPDYVGLIFYPKSKRFVNPQINRDFFSLLEGNPVSKVGVFVNEPKEQVLNLARVAQLDVIQLHGEETIEEVDFLKEAGFQVWKAVGVNASISWSELKSMSELVDAFLFDTATDGFGGSGKLFDHNRLQSYPFQTPFWLSGGIGPGFLTLPKFFKQLPLIGLDVNSKFESAPGVKDIRLLQPFLQHWQNTHYDNIYR